MAFGAVAFEAVASDALALGAAALGALALEGFGAVVGAPTATASGAAGSIAGVSGLAAFGSDFLVAAFFEALGTAAGGAVGTATFETAAFGATAFLAGALAIRVASEPRIRPAATPAVRTSVRIGTMGVMGGVSVINEGRRRLDFFAAAGAGWLAAAAVLASEVSEVPGAPCAGVANKGRVLGPWLRRSPERSFIEAVGSLANAAG
ncbi:hypothetical protein BEN49_08205 [Hymenobacter coccineus]|uniref:Uncharacterized protein n=1 Tax=Hymenobacter coccineus TaxID=1908235 RepID=A0A1G1TG34_9BACT|nr:hypothetical protein BEN49_08205 [Hymenobacter coccineus]